MILNWLAFFFYIITESFIYVVRSRQAVIEDESFFPLVPLVFLLLLCLQLTDFWSKIYSDYLIRDLNQEIDYD